MSENASSIEQINLGYHPQEDRLLLKVGMADKTELSLWITRRICKDLWNLLQNSHAQVVSRKSGVTDIAKPNVVAPNAGCTLLDDLVAEPLPAPKLISKNILKTQALAAFTHEIAQHKSLEVMDFSTEYATNRQALSDAPILVVQCSIALNELQATTLIFQAQQGDAIKMGLTLELVVALTNMMQLATREANWDLLMLQNNASLHLMPSEQVLH